MHTHVSHFT